MKRTFGVILILLCFSFTASCDAIEAWLNEEPTQTKPATKKQTASPKKVKPETKTQPQTKPPTQPQPSAPEESEPYTQIIPQKVNLKPYQANQKTPASVKNQLGGTVDVLATDYLRLATSQGSRLNLYDKSFHLHSSLLLSEVVQSIDFYHYKDADYLLITGQANTLFIVNIDAENKMTLMNSYQLETAFQGPFFVTGPGSLGMESDKLSALYFVKHHTFVEIIDLQDPQNPQKLGQLPLAQVDDVLATADAYYFKSDKTLRLVDAMTLEVKASIPFESDFKILTVHPQKQTDILVLGIKNNEQMFKALQFAPLVGSGLGIQSLGEEQALDQPVQNILPYSEFSYLILQNNDQALLYDLTIRQTLKGNLEAHQLAYSYASREIVASQANTLHRLQYEIKGEKNQKTVEWKKLESHTSVDPITFTLLLNFEHALVISQADNQSQLYLLKNYAEQNSRLEKIINLKESLTHVSHAVYSRAGLLLYDDKKETLFHLDYGLQNLTTITKTQNWRIKGLAPYSDGKNSYLVLAGQNKKSKTNEIIVFRRNSATQVQKLTQVQTNTAGPLAVLQDGKTILMTCGDQGLCRFNLNLSKKTLKAQTNVQFNHTGYQANSLLLSPNKQTLYAGFEKQGSGFIAVFDVSKKEIKQMAELTQIDFAATGISGATFSKGGKVLVMPQKDEVVFYNTANPQKPQKQKAWAIKQARRIDVSHRGQVICVAQGKSGMVCSELSGL